MKKKNIEEIEFLKLPKLSRKKEVKYIGRTAIKKVANEMHFFLEVYKNEKTARDVPVVRIVVNKKDFGTFWPEKEFWSRAKITTNDYYDGLIWEKEDRRARGERRKENILYSLEDLKRVKRFFNKIKVWNDANWWTYISEKQDQICYKEREVTSRRKQERRKEALRDRAENTPELEEQKLLEYADHYIFKDKHYLYYKKKGRRTEICCSKCGGVSSASFKPGISYESNFEKLIAEPRENCYGSCPMCHELGIYKCQGRARDKYRKQDHIFLMDKYKETGVVIRYVELAKEWQLELIAGEKGLEMHGAYEKLDGIEIARTYIHPNMPTQTDFHKYDPYTGKDFWDDCNLGGLYNIQIKSAKVHQESWEKLEGTCLQYSQAKEFLQEVEGREVALNYYMVRYMRTPQIEMLVKLQLFGVVQSLIRYEYGIVENEDAKSPDAFLGIKKDKVKLLSEKRGDGDILKILKIEKQMEKNWTEDQIINLAEIRAGRGELELALQFMTLQKLLNTIEKYAECKFGTMCSHATARLRQVAQTYFDYLNMRQQLGYSLDNTVYQRPRNLSDAHSKMVTESNKAEQDKRLKEVAIMYPLIRKNYRSLQKKYFYEDDKFQIRPARSAEEIVLEGKVLHHCVGGNNYLRKHNEGESIILLLRYKEDSKVPYITVEIKQCDIIQWYGAHDGKPDKENMQKWLDAYVARLKCGGLEAGEMDQQMLAGA